MNRTVPLLLLSLLLAGASASGTARADETNAIAECDRLAANPRDPQRVGEGVAAGDVQAAAAVAACRAAVAAEPNTVRLQYQLGRALDRADQLPEAAEWYRRAADGGSVVARTSLGNMYETGQGVPQDYAQAAAFYRGAMPDDPWSFASLGYLNDDGLGVPQDYAEAQRLYRLGSAAGDSWADVKLGRMYELGHGVPADPAEAMRWYQRAADDGDGEGLLDVGVFYDHGTGVAADPAKAADYYRRAAEAGTAMGYFNLGNLYDEGRGVPKDAAEAERLWQKGVEAGVWRAKNALAYAWAERGEKLDAALKLADEALAEAPDDPDVLDTRGWILFRLGRLDEAAPLLESAIAGNPYKPAIVHDHLGMLYAARGDQAKARAAWQAALQASPDPELAEALKTKLGADAQ